MLKLSKLDKIYKSKSGERFQALTDVDLEFGSKGFVFILGKSGSGKSTLLNIIGGLDDFTAGDIEIKGKSSKKFKAKDWDSYRNTYVGFVFQEFHIIENYTISKNISLALELQGIPKKDIKPRVKEILKQVDLEKYGDRKPNELSGGQKQRIAIARALVKNPEIILADEPTGNLDEETGAQIVDILRQLGEEKLVIMVSHDQESAYKYSDRIIRMTDGKISSDQYNEGGLKYISDEIEGYRTEGELTDVIRVPKGKTIDSEKAKEINKILSRGDGGLYIPLSTGKTLDAGDFKVLNSILKKYTDVTFLPVVKDVKKIQGSKNKKHEGRVNPAKESQKGETTPFQLIKSLFPFGNTVGMALSAIWRKKFKLIFSSIIFLLAIGLFGFSETVTRFDFPKAVTNSYDVGTVEQVSLSNREAVLGWGDEFGGDAQASMPFDLAKITATMSKYPQLKYAGLYDFPSQELTVSTGSAYVSVKKIMGFLEVDSIGAADMTVAEGKFPLTFSQIMLTDFYADYLIEENTAYKTYADIIDTTHTFDNREYTVAGISDTDYETHLYLNELPLSEVMTMLAEAGAYNMHHDSKYSRIIVKEGFYAQTYKNVNVFGNKYSANIPTADAEDDWDTDWLANAFLAYDDTLLSNPKSDQYLFVPEGFTGLKEGEIIVSTDSLTSINHLDDMEAMQSTLRLAMNGDNPGGSAIFAEIKSKGWIPSEPIEVSIISEDEWVRIQKEDMKVVGVMDFWGYAQIYNTDYMYDYVIANGGSFSSEEKQEFANNQGFYDYRVQTEYIRAKLKKKGISSYTEDDFMWARPGEDYFNYILALAETHEIPQVDFFPEIHSPLVLERGQYDELNPYDKAKVPGVLVSLSSDLEQNQEFFTEVYDLGYQHGTLSGTVLGAFDDFVEDAADIFKYVSLGLAGFSILLMSTNISASVLASKKEIGTLRAIGAKGSDVALIFVTEAVFLATFVAILANGALLIITQILNSELSDQIGLALSIFNPSLLIAGELVVLAIIVGITASFVPARGVSLMKPIDAILEK